MERVHRWSKEERKNNELTVLRMQNISWTGSVLICRCKKFFFFSFFQYFVWVYPRDVFRDSVRENTATLTLFLFPLGGLNSRVGRGGRGRATCAWSGDRRWQSLMKRRHLAEGYRRHTNPNPRKRGWKTHHLNINDDFDESARQVWVQLEDCCVENWAFRDLEISSGHTF